ncbi:MAG: NAD-binding protein [Armatimonadetes bacterium]|nr:NAD-binding protein [Armatimonadota bacterium]
MNTLLSFWIIGAGRFGRIAAARLTKKHPRASFLVVDKQAEALCQVGDLPVETRREDGVDFLAQNLKTAGAPSFIVPAVPVHLAFEWLKKKLAADYEVIKVPVPEEVRRSVPNPLPAPETGRLYTSYATFVCPDNCPEPEGICTVTGQPRKGFLYRDLQEIKVDDFLTLGIRSLQLAPGVGGYRPEVLWAVLEKVVAVGAEKNYLLSTACLCHGVLDSFRLAGLHC